MLNIGAGYLGEVVQAYDAVVARGTIHTVSDQKKAMEENPTCNSGCKNNERADQLSWGACPGTQGDRGDVTDYDVTSRNPEPRTEFEGPKVG